MDTVDSQVRAWTAQTMEPRGERQRKPSDRFLVFDTETTTDHAQRLVFGAFLYGAYENGRCIPCIEGIIHADDLPTTDPDGYQRLKRYARSQPARVDGSFTGATVNPRLVLVPRSQFLRDYLYPLSEGHHLHDDVNAATIVGYNLPFDLSRIANDAVKPRGNRYRNGVSLEMMPNSGRYSRVRIKKMGAKGSLIGFSGGGPRQRIGDDGKFVDVATLVFALTGAPMSLDAAGKRFGIANPKDLSEQEYGVITDAHVGYCRDDVRATMQLYEVTMRELYSYDIDLPEHVTYSPASLAKAHLDKMGIRRPLDKAKRLPQEVLGYATSAFYGGRSEVRIRRQPVPAVLCDFTSMYPTVNTLMGLWELLTSEDIVARAETSAVQFLLDNATLETAFDPERWKNYRGVARVKLHGDVVPIRADFGGGNTTIGLNHAYSEEPRWYAIPDLIASALITGKPPQIEQAYRFYPVGSSAGLRDISVRGVPFDPRTQDFFKYVIEKRVELKSAHKEMCATYRETESCECEERSQIEFLKVLANSGSYGVFVEMNREDYDDEKARTVYGISGEPWSVDVKRPEKAGHYCFPPIGVIITSAARLMLALLERSVTDAGGTWAFCDTDSMCIVASNDGAPVVSSDGSLIPVLTYTDVERIRQKFDALNPYDRNKVPTLLKREAPYSYDEPQLWAYCISAKRYALYRQEADGVEIVKNTEHGLGQYMNPRNARTADERGKRYWIREIWQYLIGQDTGQSFLAPEWFTKPAMMRRTISTWNVYQTLSGWNDGKNYQDGIKPYNFHLIALTGAMAGKETLIAPFETDSDKWLGMEWRDLHDSGGELYELVSHGDERASTPGTKVATYRTYSSLVQHYLRHPETKYADAQGNVCGPRTTGMLHRRHIYLGATTYIGKESDRLEERHGGIVEEPGVDPVIQYGSERDYFTSLVVPVLSSLSDREVGRRINCHHEAVKGARQNGSRKNGYIRTAMIGLAVDVAEREMGDYVGTKSRRTRARKNWRAILAKWLETSEGRERWTPEQLGSFEPFKPERRDAGQVSARTSLNRAAT